MYTENEFEIFMKLFVDWFQALEPASQLLTGILIILGFVAIGYIIYGVLFLTWQITKLSIMIAVLSIYWTFAVPVVFIYALIDGEKAHEVWGDIGNSTQSIVSTFYPSKNGTDKLRPKNYKQSYNLNSSLGQSKSSSPVIILQEKPEISKRAQFQEQNYTEPKIKFPESRFEYNQPKKLFCPNCGMEFGEKTANILEERKFAFCEHCGEKFTKRDF